MSMPKWSLEEARHGSHQPLYIQIKEALREGILTGKYSTHEKLPSESALMRTFGVSRITIRQALRDLHNEGLVFSAQGKGTFVSKPKAVQNISRLEGFGEAMAAKGYETSAKLVSIRECRPSKAVAAALELEKGSNVVELSRVRYLNREPVSLDVSHFPVDIGQGLFSRDLSGDIFPMLENSLNVPLGAADIRIDATLSDASTREYLGLPEGDPVLRVERLTYDTGNRPVDFEYLNFRGDAYQYEFRVDRKGEA